MACSAFELMRVQYTLSRGICNRSLWRSLCRQQLKPSLVEPRGADRYLSPSGSTLVQPLQDTFIACRCRPRDPRWGKCRDRAVPRIARSDPLPHRLSRAHVHRAVVRRRSPPPVERAGAQKSTHSQIRRKNAEILQELAAVSRVLQRQSRARGRCCNRASTRMLMCIAYSRRSRRKIAGTIWGQPLTHQWAPHRKSDYATDTIHDLL